MITETGEVDMLEATFEKIRRLAVASLMMFPLAAHAAPAGDWPASPVRIVVAYPAGGSTDVVARMLADSLGKIWKQRVLVENKAGAAGTIGAEYVAGVAPDGYTLILAASPEIAIVRSTRQGLAYDPAKSFAPITLVARSSFVLAVHPSVKVDTVRDLIAIAKSQPGRLNFASFGVGTSNHLVGEAFRHAAGVDIAHVPYRGSAPAVTDLLAGRVQMTFDTYPATNPHARAGKLKILAVARANRLEQAPDLPTMSEEGVPGFIGGTWVGLLAPAGLDGAIAAKIHADVRTAMEQGLEPALRGLGLAPETLPPPEFAKFIGQEIEKWLEIAQKAGVKPE